MDPQYRIETLQPLVKPELASTELFRPRAVWLWLPDISYFETAGYSQISKRCSDGLHSGQSVSPLAPIGSVLGEDKHSS
jgi:hypothetical protein